MNDERPLDQVLAEMRNHIEGQVAEGFDTPDDIWQSAIDLFSDDADVDDLLDPAKAFTTQAIAAHLQAETSWPAETDCDRLDASFKRLESIGIIARQDFSCCGNCASGEILDEIEEARRKSLPARGYTFYDMQDAEAAVGGQGLYLGYGNAGQTEDEAVAIGHEIVAVLREHGFAPVWNGSWSTRIHVPIEWRRRYIHARAGSA